MKQGFRHQNPVQGVRVSGFTLLELMAVIAILSLLVMMAAPSFEDTTTKASIRAGTTDLATDLAYARSAAVTRSESVSLCASDESITPRVCNNGSWDDGWLVFYDTDEDAVLDAGEEVVRMGASLGRRVALTLDNAVTFSGKGVKDLVSEFRFCSADDDNARYARSIVVNVGGLVRYSRDTDSDGIHNGGEGGGNLSCP